MMKFYYDRSKAKMLKERQKNRKTNNIFVFNLPSENFIMMKLLFTLFIIKRFAQINIFKLSDDILHLVLLNKLLQGFV